MRDHDFTWYFRNRQDEYDPIANRFTLRARRQTDLHFWELWGFWWFRPGAPGAENATVPCPVAWEIS